MSYFTEPLTDEQRQRAAVAEAVIDSIIKQEGKSHEIDGVHIDNVTASAINAVMQELNKGEEHKKIKFMSLAPANMAQLAWKLCS